MKKKLIASLIVTLCFHSLWAQNINAYSDYRGYFFAFNNGISTQLEHQPVQSFQAGLHVMAYVDNMGNLKAFYNGNKVILEKAWLGTYTVTDYMVVFRNGEVLRVFDKGKIYDLSFRTGNYIVQDNLVAFTDANYLMLKAYHNGKTDELENIALGEVQGYKAGENTVAYITYNSRFRVYYNGITADILEQPPTSYECGKDFVAYVDPSSGMFKGYINGKSYKLSDFEPASYQVADSLAAFVDNEGKFNIVTGKTVRNMESYTPDFYKAEDRVVIYAKNGIFNAVVAGAKYELENFIPSEYKIDDDKVAWLDNNSRLKWLNNGTIETVTYEGSQDFEMHGNTVHFKDNSGQEKIYFNKKIY